MKLVRNEGFVNKEHEMFPGPGQEDMRPGHCKEYLCALIDTKETSKSLFSINFSIFSCCHKFQDFLLYYD